MSKLKKWLIALLILIVGTILSWTVLIWILASVIKDRDMSPLPELEAVEITQIPTVQVEPIATNTPAPTFTLTPTVEPTVTPTTSYTPIPTSTPTGTPTPAPTATEIPIPTATETPEPTKEPEPTSTPTVAPTVTNTPTVTPTNTPTATPKATNTTIPTASPVPTQEEQKTDAGSDWINEVSLDLSNGIVAYVVVNDNKPFFTDKERTEWIPGTEVYPELDELGRCGTVYACLGKETMPPDGETRGAIGMVKPSGWHTVKYPELIEDLYLYNRCHLIGWQLGNENANERNLITGTRYLNITGMLTFENEVADYIRSTGNHVLYRVTPYFVDRELVARGLLMEAESVEDKKISFCVFCYNVQPGISIDYASGFSYVDEEKQEIKPTPEPTKETETGNEGEVYLILNKNTKKAHLPDCPSVDDMKEKNKVEYHGTIEDLEKKGYKPCGRCNPY